MAEVGRERELCKQLAGQQLFFVVRLHDEHVHAGRRNDAQQKHYMMLNEPHPDFDTHPVFETFCASTVCLILLCLRWITQLQSKLSRENAEKLLRGFLRESLMDKKLYWPLVLGEVQQNAWPDACLGVGLIVVDSMMAAVQPLLDAVPTLAKDLRPQS